MQSDTGPFMSGGPDPLGVTYGEPDAGASLGQHARKRGLADLKRIAPQVVAVQFDEVEGVEEYSAVSAVVTDEIEQGNAVVIASDSFAIDYAGVRTQAR